MAILNVLLILLASTTCMAGEVMFSKFGGLNTQDNPAIIANEESPDLQNVDLCDGGTCVKKREGYGLYKALTINTSTTAVHGCYHFQDTSGNNIQLWANDGQVNAFVAGGNAVLVATIAVSGTIQCADIQGEAYCFTSNREAPFITKGILNNTTYSATLPKGTMATVTPDRLIVSGVSGALSTLYFSESNDYDDFTTNLLETSPFTEVIAAPGSRITHIRYACGKVLWWKDQSFGAVLGDNQYDLDIQIITPEIGTLDNSSAYYNGHVYFRGQDGQIYDYNCSQVEMISQPIEPILNVSATQIQNSWTQSSQTEFETGISSFGVSMTITAGAVLVSSYTKVETTATQFSSGSFSSTEIYGNGVRISTNNTNINNNGFESTSANWEDDLSEGSQTGLNCTINPRTGSYLGVISSVGDLPDLIYVGVRNCANSSTLSSVSWTANTNSCSWTSRTIPASSSHARESGKICISSNGSLWSNCSDCFIYNGSAITFYSASDQIRTDAWPHLASISIDDITSGRSNITEGIYYSSPIASGLSYGYYYSSATTNLYASTIPVAFAIQKSASLSSGWSDVSASTGDVVYINQPYVRFLSTITISESGASSTTITGLSIIARSTGTYLSAVHNATSLKAWGVFQATKDDNDGTHTFYVRASTDPFITASSTPSWTSQTINTTVSCSTGTYFQLRDDFTITAASHNPTLYDFTFNWYEGTASDKAYMEFFEDQFWISVSTGTSGLNNTFFRYDTLNNAWLMDTIASNGFMVDQGELYFGDSSYGKVYIYGDVSTDNGNDFHSYWKSKDFIGNELQNKSFTNVDWLVKSTSGTLNISYQVDASTTATTYDLNLYDSSRSILRRSKNLPAGKTGTFYNVNFGNTNSYPWEVYGHRATYIPETWKPQ